MRTRMMRMRSWVKMMRILMTTSMRRKKTERMRMKMRMRKKLPNPRLNNRNLNSRTTSLKDNRVESLSVETKATKVEDHKETKADIKADIKEDIKVETKADTRAETRTGTTTSKADKAAIKATRADIKVESPTSTTTTRAENLTSTITREESLSTRVESHSTKEESPSTKTEMIIHLFKVQRIFTFLPSFPQNKKFLRDEQSCAISTQHHSVVSLIRLKCELLGGFQSILLQLLHLDKSISTSLAKTTSGSLVESMQLALMEIKNLPPFLR